MMTLVKLIDLVVIAVQTMFGQNNAPPLARAALWLVVLCGLAVALVAGAGLLVLAITWMESRGAQWA